VSCEFVVCDCESGDFPGEFGEGGSLKNGGREAEGGGLLNADQPLGHLRFSEQILSTSQVRRFGDLAAAGSGGLIFRAHRDNRSANPA
jgi:hypothetical protein